jgi:isocitrate/isopropylmalate dehydrogenase
MKHTPELNSLIIDAGALDFVSRPEDYDTILDQMIAHIMGKQV